MLSVKGPIETTVGSDTGRHIGVPPTPTAITVSLDVFRLVDSVGFEVESEAPVPTRNDDLSLTFTIR